VLLEGFSSGGGEGDGVGLGTGNRVAVCSWMNSGVGVPDE
jgi:hypothetical protein